MDFGKDIVLLATEEDLELLKIDEEFISKVFKPYNLTQFTENPFNNDFRIPPLELTGFNEIKHNYGNELSIESKNVENRYDNTIIDTFYHLIDDYIEITYKKSKTGKFVLIRYSIKAFSILNNDIAELTNKQGLTRLLGEPLSESIYKGDDIYFYYDDYDRSINFYYKDNELKEIVIWYYEG